MRLRIGVFGGTFDPVHLGHLASATEVATQLRLELVLLVLAARPPHKPGYRPASVADRWAMLELATLGNPLVQPSRIEIERRGPSYTVDTLKGLRASRRDAELFLILGIDAYDEIDSWQAPDVLLDLANVVVTTRPGHDLPQAGLQPPVAARHNCCYDPRIGCYRHKSGHLLLLHRLDGLDISATEVRRLVRAGKDVSALTGDAVAAYIRDHDLYGVTSF